MPKGLRQNRQKPSETATQPRSYAKNQILLPQRIVPMARFIAQLLWVPYANRNTCRVGGAEAPPLLKPDERISRIRLSRELSVAGMHDVSASQGRRLG